MGKFLPFFPTVIYIRKAFCPDFSGFSHVLALANMFEFHNFCFQPSTTSSLTLDTTLEHEV